MDQKIAVILPVYNSGIHLKAMVEALYGSTKIPFKLIIIDGFSTDGTSQYCEALANASPMAGKDIEFYQIPKKGLTNAINFGIEKAGELDCYITQDDVIHSKLYGRDWLYEMREAAQNEKVGVVTGHFGWGVSGPDYTEGMRWVGTWNMYLPRRTIKKIGLFDENMGPGDDIDFAYRMSKENMEIALIDYWVQHHRFTEHRDADDELKKIRMSKYFKEKWGLR